LEVHGLGAVAWLVGVVLSGWAGFLISIGVRTHRQEVADRREGDVNEWHV
jgi:hypothetical protein